MTVAQFILAIIACILGLLYALKEGDEDQFWLTVVKVVLLIFIFGIMTAIL